MAETLPALFFGHGNSRNAVWDNSYTAGWRLIGKQLPKPKANLSVSAHWFVPGTARRQRRVRAAERHRSQAPYGLGHADAGANVNAVIG